jgi:hypothetical protein
LDTLSNDEATIGAVKFAEYFQKVPKNVRIEFRADFSTDGDFRFEEANLNELAQKLENSSLYDDAAIQYGYDHDCEDITFFLKAEGKNNACRYALRDLLEEMIASFRTYSGKYYLIKEVYDLLEGFHEVIWNNEDVDMEDYMSGNYDGTFVSLSIKEIPDEDGKEEAVAEPESKTNWVETIVDGDAKLQCPHCESVHPDVPYVRSFKHCPSCGEGL